MIRRLTGLVRPTFQYRAVEDINLQGWWEAGIRGMILDVDDTLTTHNSAIVAPAVQAWLRQAREMGFHCYIVSNNRSPEHIAGLSDRLELQALAKAGKPFPTGFLKALQDMALNSDQVVVIGDRLLTDIVGGSYLGMHTCLVAPVTTRPSAPKRVLYRFEGLLMRAGGARRKRY
jgi:HAD superfamily phosphatase (TIGR01668 family)